MRELTKSIGRFSLAFTVFGAQQATSFLRRPVPTADHPGTRDLSAASGGIEGQLDGYFLRVFEAGDRVQRSAIDWTFGVATGDALDPKKLVRLSADVVRASTDAMGQVVAVGTRSEGCGGGGEPCGWGPMPPAR